MYYCNLCCRDAEHVYKVNKNDVEKKFSVVFDIDEDFVYLCDECYVNYLNIDWA